MRFSPTCSNGQDDALDSLTAKMTIDAFMEEDESGPHSIIGTSLCHLLNHCYKHGIAYTLVFVPFKGYYVRKDAAPNIIPEFLKLTWDVS